MQPNKIAEKLLAKQVEVSIDRPLGSKHPRFDWHYPINYGEVLAYPMPDGGGIDAYVLGVSVPLETFTGQAIAVVFRKDDPLDPKLVVSNQEFNLQQINESIYFQEQFFESVTITNLRSFVNSK